MRRLTTTLPLVGLWFGAPPAAAQWGLAAEVGVARFGGSSRDSSGATVGPYRPTTLGLRLDRDLGHARVALGVAYAKTGLAAEGQGAAVVQYDLASVWEIAPEVSVRVARFGVGAEARIALGPTIDMWDLDGQRRTRVGGGGGVAFEWPLARSLTGTLRVSGTWSGSIFDQGDVPSGVERKGTHRFGGGLALRYQL